MKMNEGSHWKKGRMIEDSNGRKGSHKERRKGTLKRGREEGRKE